MPTLRTLALALSFGPWSPSACAPAPPAQVTARLDSVVRVRVDGRAGCLGSVVGRRSVLVAQHCLFDDAVVPFAPSRLQVADGVDGAYAVRSIALLEPDRAGDAVEDFAGRDLAVLTVGSDLRVPAAPLATGPDDHFWAVRGSGEHLEVTPVVPRATERDQIFTVPVTCDGDSGGPLFDDRGAIVGVASWRTPGRCGTGASVFTRTQPHLAWIRSGSLAPRSD